MFSFRRHQLALYSTVLLAACAACSAPSPAMPQWPEPQDQANNALPVGAQYVYPGDADGSGSKQQQNKPPFGSLRPDDATPEERIPAIVKRGRVIVGVAQSLNRLGFRDPVTGDLAGFEVDLAREVARDIFGDPSRVEFRYVETRDREEALDQGDVDMIIRTMSITRPRQKQLEFSIPYLKVNPRLLVLDNSEIKSFKDLKGKTVCVARDSTSFKEAERLQIGRIMHTRTWTDCLMAMQRFQVDAIYTDDAILSGLRAQDPYTTLTGDYGEDSYYGVAFAPPTKTRDTAGLVRQVNSTLERIRNDGTWKKLYDKWMAEYLGPAPSLPMTYRTPEQSAELEQMRGQVNSHE